MDIRQNYSTSDSLNSIAIAEDQPVKRIWQMLIERNEKKTIPVVLIKLFPYFSFIWYKCPTCTSSKYWCMISGEITQNRGTQFPCQYIEKKLFILSILRGYTLVNLSQGPIWKYGSSPYYGYRNHIDSDKDKTKFINITKVFNFSLCLNR